MWLLLVRLRAEGDDGRDLTQILYEGFQDDVELRVHAEGVKVCTLPNFSASCTTSSCTCTVRARRGRQNVHWTTQTHRQWSSIDVKLCVCVPSVLTM